MHVRIGCGAIVRIVVGMMHLSTSMNEGESIRKAKSSLYAISVVLIMIVVPLTPFMDTQSFAYTGEDGGGGGEGKKAMPLPPLCIPTVRPQREAIPILLQRALIPRGS